jgi:hypothetical protein
VRELGPKIQAMADEIEQARRLPPQLVHEMQRAGVFRMAMPRAWGGPELDFLTQIRVIEELSIADASAGWCAMIGVDGGYMTAYIDQAVARDMYSDIDSVTAITFAPPGKAVKTRDGFIVNGRWPFASGCQHATWLIGHFAIFDGDTPRLQANGMPKPVLGFYLLKNARLLIPGRLMDCAEAAVTIGQQKTVSSPRNGLSIWQPRRNTETVRSTRFPICFFTGWLQFVSESPAVPSTTSLR